MTDPASVDTSEVDDAPPDDRHRLRRMRSIGVVGLGIGVTLVAVAGLAGGGGREGMAVLLLVLAMTSAVTGIYGGITLLVDDLRSVTISGRRIVLTVLGFVGAAMLMAMVAGIGG